MKTENVASIGIKSTKDETIFITSKFIQMKSCKTKNKQHWDHCFYVLLLILELLGQDVLKMLFLISL